MLQTLCPFLRERSAGGTAKPGDRPSARWGGPRQLLARVLAWRRADESAGPRRRMQLIASLFDSTNEGMVITDAEGTIQLVNPAFERLTGYTLAELVGRNPRHYQSGRHDADFYARMWSTLVQAGQWEGEIWNRTKSGEPYPTWQNISAVRDAAGTVTHYVSVLTHIGAIKDLQARLEHLANHDALTGLPNRLLFNATLSQAVRRAARNQRGLALLFLDLDHFKAVNDTLGHAVGDRLLRAVGERLRSSVRDEDTVARLGGDEFVVLLEQAHDRHDVARVAQKLIDAVGAPLALREAPALTPSCSVGIALYPAHALTAEMLADRADAALYVAKERGRHTFVFAGDAMPGMQRERVAQDRADG